MALVMPIMACSLSLPLVAVASSLAQSALQCEGLANMRLCMSTREGVTRYDIDTADGTHAELAVSEEGVVEMRQSGPDVVRVKLANAPVADFSAPPASSGGRRAYQDTRVSIDEVEDGQHAHTWVIYPHATPTSRYPMLCNGYKCSGHIKESKYK